MMGSEERVHSLSYTKFLHVGTIKSKVQYLRSFSSFCLQQRFLQ